MAGTVTVTESQDVEGFEKISFAWTSSAGGAADATTTESYTGPIVWAVFAPGVGVSAAYDVTIKDADGYDILNGLGADLANTQVRKTKEDKLGVVYDSTLTLGITNAGATKSGTIILLIGR